MSNEFSGRGLIEDGGWSADATSGATFSAGASNFFKISWTPFSGKRDLEMFPRSISQPVLAATLSPNPADGNWSLLPSEVSEQVTCYTWCAVGGKEPL